MTVRQFNRAAREAIKEKGTFAGTYQGETYFIEKETHRSFCAWIRLPNGKTKGGMEVIESTPHKAFSGLNFGK